MGTRFLCVLLGFHALDAVEVLAGLALLQAATLVILDEVLRALLDAELNCFASIGVLRRHFASAIGFFYSFTRILTRLSNCAKRANDEAALLVSKETCRAS